MEITEIPFSKLLIRNRLTGHFNLLYLSVLVLTQTAVLPTISGFSGFPGSLHSFLEPNNPLSRQALLFWMFAVSPPHPPEVCPVSSV